MTTWSVVYKRAIEKDGSLFFPERLSAEFLDKARRTMGSYLFANQYLNEIIPEDEKTFKSHWLHYYKSVPDNNYCFVFIDPAIGQDKHHDFTGIVIVKVDCEGNWFLQSANRYKINPTDIVEKIFEITKEFKPMAIGVEIVAYQEALLYFLTQEAQKRKIIVPIKGITRKAISKETRILGLVPRFEWSRIFINHGLTDFEDEYSKFPRASHDDLLDALSSLEEIVFYPQKEVMRVEKPNSPADPNYEKWYIQELLKKSQNENHVIKQSEY